MLVVLFAILAGFAAEQVVRQGQYFGFILWLSLTYLAGIYIGTTVGDLRKAYLLITGKPPHSQTPVDIFYWPFVDWNEVRANISEEQQDAEQN